MVAEHLYEPKEMDLQRIYPGAAANPFAQARTAGPAAVDTGPPGSGGPPQTVVGLQKEVTATELKPQAKILDLLETILPTALGLNKETKSGSSTASELSISLNELKAKVEAPDYSDILLALGVPFKVTSASVDLPQFKTSLAEAVVNEAVPASVKTVLAKIVQALDFIKSNQGDSTGNHKFKIVPLGELHEKVDVPQDAKTVHGLKLFERSETHLGDPRLIGPPIQPGSGLKLFERSNSHVGDPRLIGPPIQPGSGLKLSERASHSTEFKASNKATAFASKVDTTSLPSTGIDLIAKADHSQPNPTGKLEQEAISALRVTGVQVTGTSPVDLEAMAKSLQGRQILQKAPDRPLVARTDVSKAVSIGKPIPEVSAFEKASNHALRTVSIAEGAALDTQTEISAASANKALLTNRTDETVTEVDPFTEIVETVEKNNLTESQDSSETVKDVLIVERTGRAERTAETTDKTNVKMEATVEQAREATRRVIEQIEELAATRGSGRVTIRLSPEDLGSITLVVRSFGDNVEAKVTASNDSVRHALHAQRADLVQSVESRGLSMNSFSVGSESNADAQQHGEGKQQGQDMRQELARSHNLWNSRQDQSTTHRTAFLKPAYAGVDTFA